MVLGRRGPLARLASNGIGITQEYRADRKARKVEEAISLSEKEGSDHLQSLHADTETESENDEAWIQDLDATQAEMRRPGTSNDGPEEIVEDIVRKLTSANPPPPYTSDSANTKLNLPVILPQRRPGERTRGFIRGYAPALAQRDISQTAWLDFLTGLDKAISKNRWFFVLDLAFQTAHWTEAALSGWTVIANAVALSIEFSLEMGRRGYIHHKQNSYLDQMNDQFFKPRGLYALIIKYKPRSQLATGRISSAISSALSSNTPADPVELVDIDKNITETVTRRQSEESKFFRGLTKAAAAKNTSDAEIPDFAPLTFPYLDNLSEEDKQSTIKRKGAFLKDYYDRRSQANFALDNPNSKLASVTDAKLRSEYADPSNPKSQRNLLSLVSGGQLQGPLMRVQKQRVQRIEKFGIGDREEQSGQRSGQQRAGRLRPMKRMLRQDALYLMVVDMPSQMEMDAVRRALERLADGPD